MMYAVVNVVGLLQLIFDFQRIDGMEQMQMQMDAMKQN